MRIKVVPVVRAFMMMLMFSFLEPTGLIDTFVHSVCGLLRMAGFFISIGLLVLMLLNKRIHTVTEILISVFIITFAVSTLIYSGKINDTCAYLVRNSFSAVVVLKFLYVQDPRKTCRDMGIMLSAFLILDALTWVLPGLGNQFGDSIKCFLGTKTTITYYLMPALAFDYVYWNICEPGEKKLATYILIGAVAGTLGYLVQMTISTTVICLALGTAMMFLARRDNVFINGLTKFGPAIASGLSAVIITGSSLSLFTYFVTEVLHESSDLSGRIPIWQMIFTYTQRRPLFGYGNSTGIYLSVHEKTNTSAHNLFLGILLQTGIIGLSLFACVIVYLTVVNIKRRPCNAAVCRFLLGMLTIMLIVGISEDYINNVATFCVFSLIGNARFFMPDIEKKKAALAPAGAGSP